MLIKRIQQNGNIGALIYKLNDNVRLDIDIHTVDTFMLEITFVLVVDEHNNYDINNFMHKERVTQLHTELSKIISFNMQYSMVAFCKTLTEELYEMFLKHERQETKYQNLSAEIMRKDKR